VASTSITSRSSAGCRPFTPEFIDAASPARDAAGSRWFVDETYIKITGRWDYLYRAVDRYGQVIDVLVSARRNAAGARAFFTRAPRHGPAADVATDEGAVYPRVVDEVVPAARHVTGQYANDRIEADDGRLKARLPTSGRARCRRSPLGTRALIPALGHGRPLAGSQGDVDAGVVKCRHDGCQRVMSGSSPRCA